MSWLSRFMRMMGMIPPFTSDEIINAENENDLYDHRKALEAVRDLTVERVAANDKLRGVLEAAKARSQEFSQFEHLVRRETESVRRNF